MVKQLSKSMALVTGASRGIGFELTKQLLQGGAHVVAIARQPSNLEALQTSDHRLTVIALDLTEAEAVVRAMEQLLIDHPPLDLAVLNAAVQYNHDWTKAPPSPDELLEEIHLNLLAPLLIARALTPHWAARKSGTLAFINSGLALAPKKIAVSYCATKNALRTVARTLRDQAAGQFHVCEILLPLVDTDMTRGRGSNKLSASAAAQKIIDGIISGKQSVYVGKSKLLKWVMRLAPWLGHRLMRNA